MITTLISFLIFVVYLIFTLRYIEHLPKSLSETYYYLGSNLYPADGWKDTFNRLRASIFTFVIWAMAFTLLPAMLDVTSEGYKCLAFLALVGICFVGAAPEFMDYDVRKIHVAGAVLAAVLGLLWSLSVCKQAGLISLVISVFAVLVAALMTNSIKSSRTFWLEMIAFGSVYLSAIIQIL